LPRRNNQLRFTSGETLIIKAFQGLEVKPLCLYISSVSPQLLQIQAGWLSTGLFYP